ncbi:MAG: DUF1801 domain-containing protein [Bacteroidota bacterium]
MAPLKNVETDADVQQYLAEIKEDHRREDCTHLVSLMTEVTGEPAKMWGKSMIGFGSYSYTQKGKKELLQWFRVGLSNRKAYISIYCSVDLTKEEILTRLGKFKNGKGCLNIKKLSDLDLDVLSTLIRSSYEAK